ncbi:MAG: hypothetical protein IPJ75_16055 [Ignavibacteriales bacterium]|nr:hypothetical protein [Ignavibacteriales bacterium]
MDETERSLNSISNLKQTNLRGNKTKETRYLHSSGEVVELAQLIKQVVD